MIVLVKKLDYAKDLPLPGYSTEQAAAMDLRAAQGCVLPAHSSPTLIKCGIVMQIPYGYEGVVKGRSGLALKKELFVHIGTIDSDYRGEIGVILMNVGDTAFIVHRGDRIAQMAISPVEHVELQEALLLTDTERGDCGYGHTGIS